MSKDKPDFKPGMMTYSLSEIMEGLAFDIDRVINTPAQQPGYSTLLTDFDQITGGLRDDSIYLIAGRPGMGKFSLFCNIALNMAKQGIPVAIFTSQITPVTLAYKFASCVSALDYSTLVNPKNLTDSDWVKLNKAIDFLSVLPIKTIYSDGFGVSDLLDKVKQLSSEDDLTRIRGFFFDRVIFDRQDNEPLPDDFHYSILACAKQRTNAPIVILKDLPRSVEFRNNKRPIYQDIEKFIGIHRSPEVILSVYCDEHYNRDTDEKNIMEVGVLKNTYGDRATIKLVYNAPTFCINDLADDQNPS